MAAKKSAAGHFSRWSGVYFRVHIWGTLEICVTLICNVWIQNRRPGWGVVGASQPINVWTSKSLFAKNNFDAFCSCNAFKFNIYLKKKHSIWSGHFIFWINLEACWNLLRIIIVLKKYNYMKTGHHDGLLHLTGDIECCTYERVSRLMNRFDYERV